MERSTELVRMRQLLLATADKPNLAELKRLVRRWPYPCAPGQEATNRAIVRAIDEVQHRLDALLRM